MPDETRSLDAPAPDLGAEDWEFPDATDLDVPAAARLWDSIERAAAEANKRATRLKSRKAAAKELALKVLDEAGMTSARVAVADGREVQLTPYDWDVFSIKDEDEFKAWAADNADRGGEDFYDSEPRLRDGIFLDEMRRRVQDHQPLPPGVVRWTDTKISRTAVAPRRRARGGPGTEQGPAQP